MNTNKAPNMSWLQEFQPYKPDAQYITIIDKSEILFDFVPSPPHIMICVDGKCYRRYLTDKDRDKIADFITKATKWVISRTDDKTRS